MADQLDHLRVTVKTRQNIYFELVELQNRLADADHAIKKELISMGATEALTIQWGKLRRIIK